MIKIDHVSRSFGEFRALDGVDLIVPAAKTTVLIGPSGCGKSTLLRVMLGLISPTEGTVEFEGECLSQHNVLRMRHRMGYVIQDGGLFPHLTAKQNVTLMAQYLKHDRDSLHARSEELAQLTHFPEDALDRYPAQLSGGMRQRVALMRALMLDPDVLFMDEPLGALDPMIRAELQTELKDIFSKLGKTVVMVTHDMTEAAYFGHQIVIMRDGGIVQAGTLDDLTQRPSDEFVTEFINAQRSPLSTTVEVAS